MSSEPEQRFFFDLLDPLPGEPATDPLSDFFVREPALFGFIKRATWDGNELAFEHSLECNGVVNDELSISYLNEQVMAA